MDTRLPNSTEQDISPSEDSLKFSPHNQQFRGKKPIFSGAGGIAAALFMLSSITALIFAIIAFEEDTTVLTLYVIWGGGVVSGILAVLVRFFKKQFKNAIALLLLLILIGFGTCMINIVSFTARMY